MSGEWEPCLESGICPLGVPQPDLLSEELKGKGAEAAGALPREGAGIGYFQQSEDIQCPEIKPKTD